MKKIFMTLTLAVAAMIAIPTAANAQDAKPEQKTECCKKAECKKTECKKDACKNEECKKADCKDCKGCKNECNKPCLKDGKGKKAMRMHSGKRMSGEGRFAKGPCDAKMRNGAEANPMFKGITLTEAQKAKMKDLREQQMAAEKKSKADMKAMQKEDMQKRRASFDQEVEKILDKDQLKQYQANKAEMDAKRAEMQSKKKK